MDLGNVKLVYYDIIYTFIETHTCSNKLTLAVSKINFLSVKNYFRYWIYSYTSPPLQSIHNIIVGEHIQCYPASIRHFTNSCPRYKCWAFYRIPWYFHRRTLSPLNTCSCPILDMHLLLCWDQCFRKLSSDFVILNIRPCFFFTN